MIVFISYARKDAAELAQQLRAHLAEGGHQPWLDTARIAGGAVWTKDIEQAIDTCDVALALLSPGSYQSDICRAEQLRALRKGKRVIPILTKAGTDIPLHLETKNYRDLTGAKSQKTQLDLLTKDLQNPKSGLQLDPAFQHTYVTAPPLPRNYLPRPDALEALRSALLTEEPGPGIALTALKGMGGIGKTVLAQALCHDEVVQQAFPDGVIWITAGKESADDLVTRLREVGKGLNDDLAGYDTQLGSINSYRTILKKKAALIVVDDVWNARDIEPFRADSPRSRLLFTTRDGAIANAVGAGQVVAGLLPPAQSRLLLAQWARLQPEDLPPESADVIQETGHLPLALSIVGAMLRDKPRNYWTYVLRLLRDADLARLRAQFPDYPHTDLLRAIQVSVDSLDQQSRDRYLALAVLLEDMPAHSAIQQVLWNADQYECVATAEQFVSLSLAQPDRDTEDEQSEGIRLHDLQLDYVRAQHPDRESLMLIHGAVRLSANVIARDPSQFVSQLAGRLLLHEDNAVVRRFSRSLVQASRKPWLRALQPTLHPPGTALLRTLQGHSEWVNGLAVGADGRRVVSASSDKTLKVWDGETGRELGTLEGHAEWVNGVAMSADGRRAISASYDRTLKVWDVETSCELRTLEGHSDRVNGVAVSADGRRAVSASSDATLKVWDVETGRELGTLVGHSNMVNRVAVSMDGRRAVSASDDKTLKVWDVETGRELRTLEGHSDRVNGVAVSADGRRAVSASSDATLKVWDVETGRELGTLVGHAGTVFEVAVSADGRRAVSASSDETLKVWDVETGRELGTLVGHSEWINGVAVSADGRRAVSASSDKTLKVWDVETARELGTLEGHSEWINGVAVSADGRRAVSASSDKTLKVWDVETARELGTLEGHAGWVNGVAVSADGRRAVSASWDATLKVWDVETGGELGTLEGHAGWVNGVAVSGDGRRAVSASRDKTLKVWDVETGRELGTLEGHSEWVNAVAVSGDERRAVSASYDKTLKVWDVETGSELRTLQGHSDRVNGVAISADGRRAVSASSDKTLKVWDVESGRELGTLEGHSEWVKGVAMSADGRRAVSASDDNTLKVWDVETGGALATFTGDAALLCCAFAGPHIIIAGDRTGRVHFLRLENA